MTQSIPTAEGRSRLSRNDARRPDRAPVRRQAINSAGAILLLTCLAACGGMSQRGADTAVGAGAGAVAGSILTGGSAVGTVGGAVVGGVIGDSVGKHK